MNIPIPVSELTHLISQLSVRPIIPPSPDEIYFCRVWVLKKGEEIRILDLDVVSPVHTYLGYEVIDELEFRWVNNEWNLVIKTEQ